MEFVQKAVQKVDETIRPKSRRRACDEDREMLEECVLLSQCYKKTNNFKYCVQEGADPECKAIRYDLFLCKRSQVFWSKAFCRPDNKSL